MRWLKYALFAIILGLGGLTSNQSLAADWIKQGEERFKFGAGVFLPSFNTDLRVENQRIDNGTDINLEDDLGFSSSETSFWVGAYWRFASRHRLWAGYYQFNRDASATAERDLIIGEEIYPKGARLESNFKFKVMPLAYGYSFMKREKFELTGTIGLNWNWVDFDVKGSASLGGQDFDESASASASVPLPLIGLDFTYHFTPKWSAGLHGEVFWLEIDADTLGFSGTFLNFRASTEYWFFNNFGVGLALNWFSLDVDVDDGTWRGALDYQYWGPQIYLAARF